MTRRHLLSALQVVGLVLLGGVFVAGLDPGSLDLLRGPRALGWILVALLAYTFGQVLNGLAWRHLLNRAGGQVTVRDMLLHDLSSVFWCSVLPGGIVGELVKGVRLARDAHPGSVAVSIAAARLTGGMVACLLALASLPWSGFGGLHGAVGAVALVGTAGAGAVGLVALRLGPAALPGRFAAWVPEGAFPTPRALGVAFLLALATHSAFALVFSACFAAAGTWASFPAGAVLCALTSVAQILPLSVGGVGVRELTVSTLGLALVPEATADAAAIAIAIVFTTFVALGGAVELWRTVALRGPAGRAEAPR